MVEKRLKIRLERQDFENLQKKALEDNTRFTSKYTDARSDLYIIALGQGAAAYYAYPEAEEIGIKDLDLYLFYKYVGDNIPSWRRTKRGTYEMHDLKDEKIEKVKIDFIHRAIKDLLFEQNIDKKEIPDTYLNLHKHVRSQPIIGLWPEDLFMKVLHKPPLEYIRDYRRRQGKPSL